MGYALKAGAACLPRWRLATDALEAVAQQARCPQAVLSLRSSRPATSQSTPEAAAEPDCHGEAPLDGQGQSICARRRQPLPDFAVVATSVPAQRPMGLKWAWREKAPPAVLARCCCRRRRRSTPPPGSLALSAFPSHFAPFNRRTRFVRTLMLGATPRAASVSGSRIQSTHLAVGAPTCLAHIALACSPACLRPALHASPTTHCSRHRERLGNAQRVLLTVRHAAPNCVLQMAPRAPRR